MCGLSKCEKWLPLRKAVIATIERCAALTRSIRMRDRRIARIMAYHLISVQRIVVAPASDYRAHREHTFSETRIRRPTSRRLLKGREERPA
jgi:hypothetical protein